MIEIFKTNIQQQKEADHVLHTLTGILPDARINFALDDHDRILRIDSVSIDADKIISVVTDLGFLCKVIPDKICKDAGDAA